MAYLSVTFNQIELERRPLTEPLVIGRAPECDIAIRDIALSRRHCRIEKTAAGWVVTDLRSKNGTAVNHEKITEPRLLAEGDAVRIGRAKILFHTADLPAEDVSFPKTKNSNRPVDPHEALAGTVAGFVLLEAGTSEPSPDMPKPQPSPKDPAAFEREQLYTMFTAIASSSWDSIYAEAKRPTVSPKPASASIEEEATRVRARPRSPIDLSLQVTAAHSTEEADASSDASKTVEVSAPMSGGVLAQSSPPAESRRVRQAFGPRLKRAVSGLRRSRRAAAAPAGNATPAQRRLTILAAAVCVAALLAFAIHWLLFSSTAAVGGSAVPTVHASPDAAPQPAHGLADDPATPKKAAASADVVLAESVALEKPSPANGVAPHTASADWQHPTASAAATALQPLLFALGAGL